VAIGHHIEPVSMSTGRSSTYSRTPSVTRPMPQINNPSTVSSISRSIQTGSMNVTTNIVRARPISGLRQSSIDRARNIPSTISSTQRRISTDSTRSRLSSQDRNLATNEYPERQNEESTMPKSSSNSPSPPDSRLSNGGLTGLQNLGNTVI
jgi:hypothetical protein